MTNSKRAAHVASSISFVKELTGYDKPGSCKLTPGHVVLKWPTLVPALSALRNWRTVYTSKAPNLSDGQTRCEIGWTFERAGEQIEVEALVFVDGAQAAQDFMFYSAAGTTMLVPPYVGGPEIGDCCIMSQYSGNLRWCHGNVFCSIDSCEKNEIVVAVARELESLMAKHSAASIAGDQPIIDSIKVSSNKVSVGDKITIDIRLRPTAGGAEKIFDADCDTNYLSYESLERLASLEFRAVNAGHTEVQVLIADAETLIATKVTVPIEIQSVPLRP